MASGFVSSNELEKIYKKFTNVNWFRNWFIFATKVKTFKQNPNLDFNDIRKAFLFLIYDTEPFKGQPRTCDLYAIQNLIYNSINEGLSFVKSKEDWGVIVDILQKFSDATTTSFQKSLSGPLSTDAFYQILDENINELNIDYIITIFEKELSEKEPYHLHSYLSEYSFRLSKLYSIVSKQELAEQTFQRGVQYLLGYTFRRDLTIEDLIESVVGINSIDNQIGVEFIKKIKPLVDAVIDHTDGKDTQYFLNDWFRKYLNIDFKNSSLYLRHELIQTRLDWRLEKSLLDLLEKSNGEINPIIELLICRTFPIENSKNHLLYALNLIDLVGSIDFSLAKRFFISIYEKSKNEKNSDYSSEFYTLLNKNIKKFSLDNELPYRKTKNKEKSNNYVDPIYFIKNSCIVRKEFSDMTIQELAEFISLNKITGKELNALVYIFDSLDTTSTDYKDLIKAFFSKTHLHDYNKTDSAILFKNQNEITVHYWVSRYVNDMSGWFELLINTDAFKNAYDIDVKKTMQSLCELLFEKLNIHYTRVLSANLLNGLVKVGFDKNVIKQAWYNLFDAINYRLPSKEDYNWGETLENDLNMNSEEIFICLLFSRFKANTTERYEWTLSGLTYLLFNYPSKMIKPIKWFLMKKEYFIDSVVLSVIELIYEYNKIQIGYANNFKSELDKIYPTNYFLIDVKLIVTQMESYSIRLPNLIYPSKIENDFSKAKIDIIDDEWVRIGYCESELFEDSRYELKEYKVFGGIDFALNPQKTLPFSPYPLESQEIWEGESIIPIDNYLVNYLIQNDSLEGHKVLWLNPNLMSILGLKPINFLNGLAAENAQREIVLKYNSWRCNYLGTGDFTSMADEIPKLEGAELLMRKDVFENVCKIYGRKPSYCILKVIPTLRDV